MHHLKGRQAPGACYAAVAIKPLFMLLVFLSLATKVGGEVPALSWTEHPHGPSTAGTTWRVCASGCAVYDFTTISAAVAAASSGDEIHVAQGTYHETVQVLNKSLTLLGGYSRPSWEVRDPETLTTIIDANGAGTAVILASTTGVHTGMVDGFTITGGSTSGGGGGIRVKNYQATISHNRIHDNGAVRGGGIYVQNATNVDVLTNTLRDNTASNCGGAIRVSGSTASISGNDIQSNTAGWCGGGISVDTSTVTISDNELRGNEAQRGAGIMFQEGAAGTITENRIKRNHAGGGGGGIRIENAEATIQGNEIMKNTAGNIGGGIAVVSSDATVEDNDITENVGGRGGGGIQFGSYSTGRIYNNRILDNRGEATGGGGVHFWFSSPDFISNTVLGNTGVTAGGGMHIESSSPLVRDNVITDNHTDDNGGGVNIISGSEPTLIGNTVARNTASVVGGGIFCHKSAPHILQNEIVDNKSPNGGGLSFAGSVGFEVINNVIARNEATVDGGGIRLASTSRGEIVNNTIVDNDLGSGGEAISLRNDATAWITNNILVGHKYGVWAREQASATVEYNNVWQNSVARYSGVSPGPGSISCDPQFADRSGGDYHLSFGSCAIDVGTNGGAPDVDFDDDLRPMDGDLDGTAWWDMGADEYQYPVWVTKEASTSAVDPGDSITYNITYRNNGATIATNMVVTDTLSADLINPDYTFSGPNITLRLGTVYVWDVVDDLSPGAEGTITITAQVDPGLATPAAIANSARLSMDEYGPFDDDVMIIVGGLRTHFPIAGSNYQ